MRRWKFHDLLGRPFLRQAKWGGGREWWDEGSIDFEKMYTLYILEMHIGKKRILHIILVHRPKKFTHVQWAKKKKVKCNTFLISSIWNHLFIIFLHFKFLSYHYFNGFCFHILSMFTFFLIT